MSNQPVDSLALASLNRKIHFHQKGSRTSTIRYDTVQPWVFYYFIALIAGAQVQLGEERRWRRPIHYLCLSVL